MRSSVLRISSSVLIHLSVTAVSIEFSRFIFAFCSPRPHYIAHYIVREYHKGDPVRRQVVFVTFANSIYLTHLAVPAYLIATMSVSPETCMKIRLREDSSI